MLAAMSEFSTGADLYGYSVSAYSESGIPLSRDDAARDARWIIFDNVYVRTSGGRSPRNADTERGHNAGFLAKGGPRSPERARALWAGAVRTFGPPAGYKSSGDPTAESLAPSAPSHQPFGRTAPAGVDPAPSVASSARSTDATPEWAMGIVNEVTKKWESLEGAYELWSSGYMVFYSAVVEPVGLMLVGTNPGGGPEAFDRSLARRIPDGHDYFDYNYPMATNMRSLFQAAGKLELLRSSLKTNLNFFRSRSVEEWKSVPEAVRRDLESLCLEHLARMIERANPRGILAEGFQAFDSLVERFGYVVSVRSDLKTSQGQRLYAVRQNSKGRLLLGIRHPTGARTSSLDLQKIASALALDLA